MRNYETLKWEGPDPDGVAVLTFNRPEKLNAFNDEARREVMDFLYELRCSDDVGALVVTGAGSAFSAGGDIGLIQRFSEDESYATSVMDQGLQLPADWLRIRPPVVAAVNGHAIGLGATFALLSDIVVMSSEAKIADPHVRAGIVAGDGGALIWPALLGPNLAKEFLMTGDSIDAATARSMGLVNRVVPPDEVFPTAEAIARRLATGARHAIAWTKQVVNTALLQQAAWQIPLGSAFEARTMAQADVGEGTAAFRERRPPRWPSANGRPVSPA